MEITQVSITDLIPYEKNNRDHSEEQIDRIANSISEFGFNLPILADEKNIILAGHGRLLAAKKLGLEKVPVFFRTGLTEAKKKAYRILDNKLQEDSEWNLEALESEIAELEELDFPLEAWGLEELKDLFPANEAEIEDDDFDETGTSTEDCFIKRGDVIEMNGHRLMCGDSTSHEDYGVLTEGKAAVLIVTDPPYGVNYDPKWREDYDGNLGTRATGAVTNDNRADWEEVFSLWQAGVIYCWHAGLSAALVQRNLEAAGYKIVSQIIWAKPIFVFGRGDYHWKHEPCWYAAKGNHNWQGARDQSTVWDISNNSAFSKEKEERTGHSTQKPLECMARPMRNNSEQGDLIFDPFMGSGSTLIAAEQLSRVCYGMEIEPKYCHIIVERYKRYCANKQIDCEIKLNGSAITL